MKKFYTLFISLILLMASVTFIACQTNAEENKDDDKATEYTITINAPNGTVEFDKTKAKAGETVKLIKLEADDGYTFKTMSIKKENGEDVTEVDRQNQTFTMPESNVTVSATFEKTTPTYTVSVPNDNYTTSSNSSYKLVVKDSPINGYKKDDPVEILITNGNFNVNTGWGTPEGLYLVKVSIKDSNDNDIKSTVGLKIEDNKIKFTMPDKNINVFAEFCDIKTKPSADIKTEADVLECKAVVMSSTVRVRLVLCFDNKVYDNLSEVKVDGKYVFDVGLLETEEPFYFTEICSNPIFGVITTDNTLTILSPSFNTNIFIY